MPSLHDELRRYLPSASSGEKDSDGIGRVCPRHTRGFIAMAAECACCRGNDELEGDDDDQRARECRLGSEQADGSEGGQQGVWMQSDDAAES